MFVFRLRMNRWTYMVRAYYMQMRWDMALGDAEKHDLLQLNMYISISMITWHFDTMIRIQKWKIWISKNGM